MRRATAMLVIMIDILLWSSYTLCYLIAVRTTYLQKFHRILNASGKYFSTLYSPHITYIYSVVWKSLLHTNDIDLFHLNDGIQLQIDLNLVEIECFFPRCKSSVPFQSISFTSTSQYVQCSFIRSRIVVGLMCSVFCSLSSCSRRAWAQSVEGNEEQKKRYSSWIKLQTVTIATTRCKKWIKIEGQNTIEKVENRMVKKDRNNTGH